MRGKTIDLRTEFNRLFESYWPMALQWLRSTQNPGDIFPGFKEPVKKLLYDYATETGQMPDMEKIRNGYLFFLEKVQDSRVENISKRKARRQKKRGQRKADRQERRSTGNRRGLGKFAHNLKGKVNLGLLVLAPLRKVMKMILSKQGISTPKGEKLRTTVSKFMRFVIKKEDPEAYNESVTQQFDDLPDDAEGIAIGAVVASVISIVKNFIQNIAAKKRAGEKLKPIEEDMLKGADAAAKEVQKYKNEEIKNEVGSVVTDPKSWIIGIVGILVLVYLFRAANRG